MANWKEEDVSLLEQGVRKCRRCPAFAGCQCPMPAEVGSPTDIMVIGNSPDLDDDLYSRPFYSKGGRTVQRFLSQAAIPRSSVWMTYLTKCHKDGVHDPLDVQMCSGWLELEFELVRPSLVILLGDAVIKHFYPDEVTNVESSHGEVRIACSARAFQQWQETIFFLSYDPYTVTGGDKLSSFIVSDSEKLRAVWQKMNVSPE